MVVTTDEFAFVFGANVISVYCEVFSIGDGKPVCRFSSAYARYQDPWKEDDARGGASLRD